MPRPPLIRPAAPVAGGAAARAVTPAVPRVLVVDDVAANRSVLCRWLARRGCRADDAANGVTALELAARERYDLVLLDLEMPDVDGYEVLCRLKAGPATRDIPVVMISGRGDLGAISRCIRAGAEDYLPKPFEPALLDARVDASLDRKRLRDAETEYLRQVSRVIAAAQALEAGHYEPGSLAETAVRPDELGRLARVFDAMAARIRAREELLQGRLDALRAEIGAHTRTARAVPVDPRAAVTRRLEDHSGPASPRVTPVATGAVIAGRFEIVAELGSGGMGVVFRAHDRELHEDVALKLLNPDIHWDDGAVERFRTETRLARQLSSPHVVRTYDLGIWQGMHYLTMEYVPGITVRELIASRGRLTPAATLGIAGQLAEALDVAHQRGVIHRDIKPENLLLDDTGTLKIMDFGVALMLETPGLPTRPGVIMGTPAYMSPEQLLGDSVDGRTDLYATGVVMYECLTGRLPIEADSPFQMVARVLEVEPDPPAALAPISETLSQLVLRLIAKRREQRPATAAEFGQLLAAVR